jgi:hypothetical protein
MKLILALLTLMLLGVKEREKQNRKHIGQSS